LSKDLQYVGRFSLGGIQDGEEIVKIGKVGPNIAFMTRG
jgi:hypothetical protein